jgi:RHS repeat-associated protein
VEQSVTVEFAFAQEVESLDPAAYWPLSDTTGSSAADASGNGNTGTIEGGVTKDTTPGIPAAPDIPSMKFNGTTGYITTPYAEPASTAFSMSAWFKTTSTHTMMVLASARDNNAYNYSFALSVGGTSTDQSAGEVAFFLDGNGYIDGIQSNASYKNGAWNLVTGVWSAPSGTLFEPSQMTLYINGAPVSTSDLGSGGEFTSPAPGGGQLDIGDNLSGWNLFSGDLADIAVFPSSLTPGDVQMLYGTGEYQAGGSCSAASLTASPASPAYQGSLVTFNGSSTCSSGTTPLYQLSETPSGGSPVVLLTSLTPSYSWATQLLPTGSYTLTLTATPIGGGPAGSTSSSYTIATNGIDSAIASLSPSAFWPLSDVDSDFASDLSGNGNTGTLTSGVSDGVTPGIPAYSLVPVTSFNGSGYIWATPAPISGSFTVSSWFDLATTNQVELFSSRGPDDYSFDIQVSTAGINGDIGNGSAWLDTSAGVATTLAQGDWYEVAYAVSSTGYTIYLDGTAVGSGTWPADTPLLFDANHEAEIGADMQGDASFDGKIANVAVFDYTLSASQAASLFVSSGVAQTVSFSSSPPADVAPGDSYTPAAAATSGLAAAFTSATPSVCSVSSGTASLLTSGTCTIDADQGGDGTYAPASAQQSFTVEGLTFTSSNYGPFASDTVIATAIAPSAGSISLPTSSCSNTTSCSAELTAPGTGTTQYTAFWTANTGGGNDSVTINIYWNASPTITTTIYDSTEELYLEPFQSESTDQYCTNAGGGANSTCTTATFVANDLNTGASTTATDDDGTLSGSIGYQPILGQYGNQDYTVSETGGGQTVTTPATVVTTPLGYWTGTIFQPFFLDNNVTPPSNGDSYTYETVSDSPGGAPFQYGGIDQNNTGTCEATEGTSDVYCGGYATSAVLYLQLRDESGNVLGFTPTAGTIYLSDLQLFLEEVGLGNPGISGRLLKLCSCSDPVNMESGDLYESYTDINVPGLGMNLNVTRSYNSLDDSVAGPFGYGWTSNLGMSLAESDGDTVVTITDETGSPVTFTLTDGVWSAPAFNSSTLTNNPDGTWTYTRWNGDTFDFNSSGALTSESDLNGNTTTFSYTDGELTTVTDASGRTLTLTWTGDNITEITGPDGQSVSYAYNGAGDLVEFTNQAGGNTYYTYDSDNNLLTIEDPDGNTTTNTYKASGQVATQTDPDGNETTFTYSVPASGDTATLVKAPDGDKTYFLYSDGLLDQETKAYDTSLAVTTSYTYDPITLGVATETDPNGNVTSYTYDQAGNTLTETDPLGNTTSSTYNSLNEPLTVSNPVGTTTTYTYDANGNLLSTSTPLAGTDSSRVTTYSYGDSSAPGLPSSMTNPDGDTTTYTYDSYGDLTSSTNAAGEETTYTYNALGEKLTMVSPDGNVAGGNPSAYQTTYTYDAMGDLLTTTNPDGDETVDTYDADGNLLTSTDASGNETITTYNGDGEPTEVQDENSGGTVLRTTYTAYDGDGNVVSTTDGDGNETTYTFNALNHETSSKNPLGEETEYTYDGDGNLLTKTEPGGDVISYGYDADSQLTSVSYSDGSDGVSYSYDDLGEKISLSDATGTSTWTYDSLGDETSYINGAGSELQYGYDLAGNQTSIAYVGLGTVTEAYNDADEMTALTDWSGNTSSFTYDASGNLLTEGLANGVTNSYTYDGDGNLTAISDRDGGTTIFTADYGRNADELVASDSSQPSTSDSYEYTGLNQVCYAGSSSSGGCSSPPSGATTYAYDASGNLTDDNGTQQEFNAGDELCWTVSGSSTDGCSPAPTGATSYTYNAAGELTKITPATGNASKYTYDAAGQMASYESPAHVTTDYVYDGDGLLQDVTTNGTTTALEWNDAGSVPVLAQMTDAAGTTSYIDGPTGMPLEEVLPSGATYYYSQDDLGSTRALTTSTGAVADTDTYGPYGNVTASTGTVQNNLLFCGQYMDAESGLYYLQARYYDPSVGQFTSVDPLVAETQMPYAYVAGDPLNATDLTGLCSGIFGCIGSVVGTAAKDVAGAASSAGGWVEKHPLETVGIAAGAISLLSGVGEIAGGLALADVAISGGTLGAISFGAGTVAAGLDGGGCVFGHSVADCVGLGLSLPGVAAGAADVFAADVLPDWLAAGARYLGIASSAASLEWGLASSDWGASSRFSDPFGGGC